MKVIKTGKPFEVHDLIPHPQLGCIHPYLRAFKVLDGLGIIIRDITKEIESERTLTESEEKYRTLSSNIPGMVYRGKSDWETEIMSNSEMVCGYSADDFQTQKFNWLDLIHPDDKQRVLEEGAKLPEKPMSLVQEYRILAKDGSTRWVGDYKTSFFEEDGVFLGVDGVAFDITERKQMEESLRASEVRYRYLVENVNDIIYTADANGIVTYVSTSVESVIGYNQAELIGCSFKEFIYSEDLPRVMEEFQSLLSGNTVMSECRILNKEGDICWLSYSHNPRLIGDKVVEIYGVLRDVTELKKAQQQSIQQERLAAVGQLAAGIAHDFNNILNVIIARTQVIQFQPDTPDSIRERLDVIKEQGFRAANLIRQILDFSRQSIVERQPLSLVPFFKEVVKLLRATIEIPHACLKS